jgi:hypothetical protein
MYVAGVETWPDGVLAVGAGAGAAAEAALEVLLLSVAGRDAEPPPDAVEFSFPE